MSKGGIILLLVFLAVAGIGGYFVLKGQKSAPPVSGQPNAGPAPRGSNKLVNTVNDVLGFTNQAVSILGNWNAAKKTLA